jgi:hypothetical protein
MKSAQMAVMLLLSLGCSDKSEVKNDPQIPKGDISNVVRPVIDANAGAAIGLDQSDKNNIDIEGSDAQKTALLEDNSTFPEQIPAGGPPQEGEPVEGEPPPPGEGPPPPPVESPEPKNVPTPPPYEGVLTFKDYCMIAEDRATAEGYKDDFESDKHFESWLFDIQVTVAAIRRELKEVAAVGLSVEKSCDKAYKTFQSVATLSLENDNIVNVSPISGFFPNLASLDLRDNLIQDMTFLRCLELLKHLDVSNNFISQVPPLVLIVTKPDKTSEVKCGMWSLAEFGIERQFFKLPEEEKAGIPPLKMDGLRLLAINPRHELNKVRINLNLVDPNGFRGLRSDLTVSKPNNLNFKKTGPACKAAPANQPMEKYPVQIEEVRVTMCK